MAAAVSIFGSDFQKNWPVKDSLPVYSEFGKKLLKKCEDVKKADTNVAKIEIKEFMETSSNFPLEFGIDTCRVLSQSDDRHDEIRKQIVSAYPLIHERTLALYANFLEHKTIYGNKKEKPIYNQLTICDLVQRLLTKRCASFFSKNDKYLLLSGERGISGFMPIGTDVEIPPLLIENVLSYDEIKLSALLSVSSHTDFINDGARTNCGVIEEDKSKIENDGVVIGLIGARLSRREVMEYQDIIITKTQNTKQNGYGLAIDATADGRAANYRRIYKSFYEDEDFLYENVSAEKPRFGATRNQADFFDNVIMKKRYAIAFDTLLLESEARAAAAGKQAYVHVVGIGLGVWRVADQQEKIFLETFNMRLNALIDQLPHIGVIHFSWFKLDEWCDLKNNTKIRSETHPAGGIHILISKRNPAEKLRMPEHENMLLIVSYPWDGNALPGNEFWMKMLKSTGDSSTACSTLITELHNPHINCAYVNGDNLHIASEKYGILHVADYVKKISN